MSSLIEHAWTEFRAAGWCDGDRKFKDEMQEMICKHVLTLLEVFSDEGHQYDNSTMDVRYKEEELRF